MADSEVRQRKAPAGGKDTKGGASTKKLQKKVDKEDGSSMLLDVFRVLTFLLLASCGISYFISGGESFFWGMKNKPQYLKVQYWKNLVMGPQYMTLSELAAFNGKDESKPLYLVVNGTIYDVSVARHMYGPGAGYNVFVGRDASRAFVTGCFAEENSGDMRGVEQMYLPLDDPKIDAQWTTAEMTKLKEQELEAAQARVDSQIKHWVSFFESRDQYPLVGYVKYPEGWPENQPVPKLCKKAVDGRKPRHNREDK